MKHAATPRFDLIFICIAIFAMAPLVLYLWPTFCYRALSISWIFLACCAYIIWRTHRHQPTLPTQSSTLTYVIRILGYQVALIFVFNTLLYIIFNYVPAPASATLTAGQVSLAAQQHLLTAAGLYPWSLYLTFTLIYLWRHELAPSTTKTMQGYLQQSNIKRLIDSLPNAISMVAMIGVIALLLSLFAIQGEIWLGLKLNNPAYQKLYLCTPIIFSIVFAIIGSKYAERRLVMRLSSRIDSLGFLFVCYSLVFALLIALAFKGIAVLGGPLMIALARDKANRFMQDNLLHTTTLFCWALQMAWAPYVATLLARLSQSRKLITVSVSILILPLTLTSLSYHSPHLITQTVLQLWQKLTDIQQQLLQISSVLISLGLVITMLSPVKTSKHLIHGWLAHTPPPKRPLQYHRLLKILLMSTVSCMALLSMGGIFALEYISLVIAIPILCLLMIKMKYA